MPRRIPSSRDRRGGGARATAVRIGRNVVGERGPAGMVAGAHRRRPLGGPGSRARFKQKK